MAHSWGNASLLRRKHEISKVIKAESFNQCYVLSTSNILGIVPGAVYGQWKQNKQQGPSKFQGI